MSWDELKTMAGQHKNNSVEACTLSGANYELCITSFRSPRPPAQYFPHTHVQRRRGVQSPGGLSLIIGHHDAGGCARSVHKILEKQTQASLVLTPPASFAVRSAFLHRPPQFERRASHACTPCCSPLFNI